MTMKSYKGISASFVRAFLLSLDEEFSLLRESQEAAIEKSTASIQTAKKLSRELHTSGYYEREKRGRSYWVKITEAGTDFLTWVLDSDYGRSRQIEFENYTVPDSGVVLGNRVPRAHWSDVMRQVKDREMQTAFIPKGAEVFIRINGEEMSLEVL